MLEPGARVGLRLLVVALVLGVRLAGGTDEVMRNIIAEQVLGLPQGPRADKGLPFQDIPTGP